MFVSGWNRDMMLTTMMKDCGKKGDGTMTFMETEINQIQISKDPEPVYLDEDKQIAVDFYPGYSMRRKVLDFLGIDLDNIFTDMWLDATAMIDPNRRLVTELSFEVPLETIDLPTELSLRITNFVEGKLFFDRLMETSNGGLEEFIKEYDGSIKPPKLTGFTYKTALLN